MMSWRRSMTVVASLSLALGVGACIEGPEGLQGDPGPVGPQGPPGSAADAGTGGSSSGSRLKLRFYMGADGSRTALKVLSGSQGNQVVQDVFEDTMFNTRCIALNAADDRMRCLPFVEIAISAGHYADAACSVSLFIPRGTFQTPRFVFRDVSDFSNPTARYQIRHVASEHTGTVYQTGAGTPGGGIPCNQVSRSPLLRYFLAGTEIPATDFVAFTEGFE